MNDAAGPWMAVAISTTRRCSKGVDMFFLLLRPPGGPFPRAASRPNSAEWLRIVFVTLIETAVQIVVDSNERIGQRFN